MKIHLKNKGIHPIIFIVIGNIILLTCTSFLNLPKSRQWADDLLNENTFKNPDKNYYPETWFHFIGGNISKEGITADLEAIASAGISGIQLFHGQFGGAWPGVSPQIKCLSESWNEHIQWTAKECERLDLNFTMQNCPGWSYAGGPWIKPENSMRHLVYSRTDIEGGRIREIPLTKPRESEEEWRDYKDLFVLAFPTPLDDTGNRIIPKNVKSNRNNLQWKECLWEQKNLMLPPSLSEPTIIDVDFNKKITLRTVEFPPINSFSHAWCYSPGVTVTIYAVSSGKTEPVAHIEMPSSNWQDDKPISIACKEIPSKAYRIEIENLHEMNLSYINFYSAARQQNWESEGAWTLRRIVRENHPEQSENTWIDPKKIIDITSKMNLDGTLSWDSPKGKWTILRIGHINTGMKNGPAPPEATGWECNKLDVSGIKTHFDGYIGRLINENDGILNKGLLHGLLLDSWECKTQTWTLKLDTIFYKKWHYPLLPMIPALFGYVVDNPENTARFLRDWRVTLNDLLVNNFFGEIKTLAENNGLKVSFETACGDVFPGDIMEYYKYADIPMCEFWQPKMDSYVGSIEFKPVKPCVSAARMYGKKRVAAEAFTSFNLTWDEHPRFLKDRADEHFARGVTHPVFHTYTHNPRTDFLPPGSSFGSGIGTPFLRLQTWWQHMPYFTTYLARCTYMLECGRPVSDVLMYLGDEQNHKPPQSLDFPEGYSYDYCNPDALLNRLSVKDGEIITPEGISYRILWLYDCRRMLPETLEKILSFVKQGILLVGDPPSNIATLSGSKETKLRFERAVKELWGNGKEKIRKVGKGKVYRSNIESVLNAEKIRQDINVNFSDVSWLHRQTNNADFYFVSAPADKGYNGNISFRCKGSAEIWDPLTGEITKASSIINKNGCTTIEMNMPAGTSCFVVFRKNESREAKNFLSYADKMEIRTPWKIHFPSGWGIPDSLISVNQLMAWKDLPLTDEGKSFSGTAVYTTSFNLDKKEGIHYALDLGRVEVVAKVKLNGEDVGTRWTYPYRMEITDYLKSGENTVEIAVTGTWHNRLVYDANLPEKERKTWTINGPDPKSSLKEYGLLGPVCINYTNQN